MIHKWPNMLLGGMTRYDMSIPIYISIPIFVIGAYYFGFRKRPNATTKPKPEPLPVSGKPKPPQPLLMALTQNEQKLASGDRDSIFDFADSEECIVVDHRSEEEPIFEDVAARLPVGYFKFEFIDEKLFRVTCGGRTGQLELKYNPEDRYLALNFINGMILPDYEMKILRCRYGDDTHSFLLRPSSWWAEFAKAYHDKMGELFVDLDEKSCFH